MQGPLGDAQGLADLLGRKPPDSCRLGGEGMERRHSLQKTLKVRLQLFIGARFHKDAIHNAEGLGDFCVKDVQDNPSLQKTIPMSAPDRSSPLKGKNDRLSRPEKGLQKRVNLMQQKTNSDGDADVRHKSANGVIKIIFAFFIRYFVYLYRVV